MKPLIPRRIRRLGLACVFMALAGCASMSVKECLTADWTDQGYRDGRSGLPASRVEDHREACASVGVMPDITRYMAGRDQGILLYCTPLNAQEEGRRGNQYRNTCPVQLEGMFLQYHRLGYRVHEAEQRLDNLDRRTRQLERALSKEKDKTQQSRLRNELRDLDRQLRRARDDLRFAESSLRH